MSEYTVNSHVSDKEWQVVNKARNHEFICDTVDQNAGPNPAEYLCGSVNSCLSISAAMIAKVHQLDVKNFKVENKATTKKLEHGKSIVSKMEINLLFDTSMNDKEKQAFVDHVLRVSTIYQTLKSVIDIDVKF
ncbi:OsmC family protein [Lactobacillus hamsteri]|uniref:Redox protein, regulator of disulfide bond formation n=1 Tax=Lactobacillus hamsteri DSM 5661 = JCM 6256 TaxID=1423754 RepID=A0A0R1YFV9_9LACO|nr:OsmC family protein [Lactobacillus hamsteri]KRM41303.1 redox protein, regulator of disulfide bond formation [Lactobacillus hamsteri DSM 5661 = JCM 6256]